MDVSRDFFCACGDGVGRDDADPNPSPPPLLLLRTLSAEMRVDLGSIGDDPPDAAPPPFDLP